MLGLRSLISFGTKRSVAVNGLVSAPVQMAKLAPVFTASNQIVRRSFMTMPSTRLDMNSMARISVAPKEPLNVTGVRNMSSLQKKRRAKMNKHKLKKRRKALKFNTKQSRA